MERRLDELKRHVRRRADTYREVANAIDMTDAARDLKRTKGKGRLGKTLMKAGVALIAVPDPITDVPGIIMLAGGYVISKFWESPGINDLAKELRTTLEKLEEARLSVE
ncbi:MAG: hypothetical protein QXX17_04110 [Conexivisphaerales archaeon]